MSTAPTILVLQISWAKLLFAYPTMVARKVTEEPEERLESLSDLSGVPPESKTIEPLLFGTRVQYQLVVGYAQAPLCENLTAAVIKHCAPGASFASIGTTKNKATQTRSTPARSTIFIAYNVHSTHYRQRTTAASYFLSWGGLSRHTRLLLVLWQVVAFHQVEQPAGCRPLSLTYWSGWR